MAQLGFDPKFVKINNINSKLHVCKTIISTGCPKNGVLTVHYGVEEITVNARKILKKFYWTCLLIWLSLKVALIDYFEIYV
jgi:hypothetical protein